MKIGVTVYVLVNTKTLEIRGVFSMYPQALKVVEKYIANEDKKYMQIVKTQFLG